MWKSVPECENSGPEKCQTQLVQNSSKSVPECENSAPELLPSDFLFSTLFDLSAPKITMNLT